MSPTYPDDLDDVDDTWTRVGPDGADGSDGAGRIGEIPLPDGGLILHDTHSLQAWLHADVAVDLATMA